MLTKVINRGGLPIAVLAVILPAVPLHSQSVELRSPWKCSLGTGYVATAGVTDVAHGLLLTGYGERRVASRWDLRVGLTVSGHGYTAMDVPGGDGQLDFPVIGNPTYEYFTVYAGPVVWLGRSTSRWSPYAGATLSGVVRLDGSQGGMGAGAVGGLKYWWSRSLGIDLGLSGTLSRLRWASIATTPRHEWGRWLSLTVAATIGLGT